MINLVSPPVVTTSPPLISTHLTHLSIPHSSLLPPAATCPPTGSTSTSSFMLYSPKCSELSIIFTTAPTSFPAFAVPVDHSPGSVLHVAQAVAFGTPPPRPTDPVNFSPDLLGTPRQGIGTGILAKSALPSSRNSIPSISSRAHFANLSASNKISIGTLVLDLHGVALWFGRRLGVLSGRGWRVWQWSQIVIYKNFVLSIRTLDM